MDPSLPTPPTSSKSKSKKKLVIILGSIAATIVIAAFVALALAHTVFRGSNGRSSVSTGNGPHFSALTSCTTNPTPLDTIPTDLTQIDQIIPLGQVNVPDHTLPTDHMYFSLKHVTSSDTVKPTIVSPGKIVVTQILNSGESKNGVQLTNDYAIDFSACQGVSFRFGHVETLTGQLADAVKGNSWDKPCEEHTPAAGEKTFYCTKSTDIVLNSGEAIGTVGGHNIGAFDLNANSNSVKDNFINPNRYPVTNATCGLDYFNSTARATLLAKVMRTVEPRCGEVAQDKSGTAQGAWFATQDTQQSMSDWNSHFSLIHHDIDPTLGLIGVGGKISSPMVLLFIPTHSGIVNREPSEITPSSTVYCYFSNSTKYGTSSPATGSTVLQLVDDKTMKIEHQDRSCSSSSTLTTPTTYYR